MSLSTLCKKFNNVLAPEVIGSLCRTYTFKIKNETLQNLITTIKNSNYETRRIPILLLIYAGADVNIEAKLTYLSDRNVFLFARQIRFPKMIHNSLKRYSSIMQIQIKKLN